MTDMKELARLMGELKEYIAACTQCGMCQSVCPVFAETGRESDVARGKLAILDGLVHEIFKDPKGTSDRLERCALCGSCAFHCPGNVNILEIFLKARVILSEFIRLPWYKKVLFRRVLGHPVIFHWITACLRPFQKIFTRRTDSLLGTSCARTFSPILKQRHFIPLASPSFQQEIASMNLRAASSQVTVAFFTGCLVDKLFPQVAKASLETFKYHNIGVLLPSGLGCCGIPALASGDIKAFYQLRRLNIEKLGALNFDFLITPCATCAFTIKKIWPMIADNNIGFKHKIDTIASVAMDISEFLVKYVEIKPLKNTQQTKGVVSYHDPCHLKKSLNVFSEPRTLLQSNTGYQFTEMQNADKCCGMGGSFSLNHYDIASGIGALKRQTIVETGCNVVATGCPACMIQISDMLSKHGDPIQVKHVIEIYSESLK